MTQPTEGWHRRAFRGLLLLYPRWFREAHGEEMTLLFSARLERAGGELGTDPPLVADDCGCWGDVVAVAPSGQTRGILLDTLLQDLRYAARRLLRSPAEVSSAGF